MALGKLDNLIGNKKFKYYTQVTFLVMIVIIMYGNYVLIKNKKALKPKEVYLISKNKRK